MLYSRHHRFGHVEGFEVGIAPTGRPLKSVYLYKVGSLLVDTGPSHLQKRVDAMLAGSDITTIVLTHHHEDHSGNAAFLKKRFDVPVYLHPYGVDKLSRGYNILPYQHMLFGKPPRVQAQSCPDTIQADGFTLEALHTPGHSKDHTVFHVEKEGWLFSGDLWVADKIQFFRVDERIDQQIASLRKIAALDFESLFCGHRPIVKKGHVRIMRKLDYLVSFQEQVVDLYRQGCEVYEIARKLRWKSDVAVRLFTMGNAGFSHMVRSCINTYEEHLN